MTRRHHDVDAGGDPSILQAKAALREEVWECLERAGVDRFPGASGRIPNFVGAEGAAEHLRGLDAWRRADTLKANPDSPQWPVRQRALEDAKRLFMAVPRLAADHPFVVLAADELEVPPRRASSIKGATRFGRSVSLSELEPVDFVIMGCVAVAPDGARLGKGGGFADLEFALAWEAGLIGTDTVVATTVHELQVRRPGEIPVTEHDVPVDLVVTPDRVIECEISERTRPGVRWEELTDTKIDAIPLLQQLRGAGT